MDEFKSRLAKRLTDWGVDLNSEVNGVWLPQWHYRGRVASLHRGGNSAKYIEEVRTRLDRATTKQEALDILASLKQELLNGTLKVNNAE